MVLDLIHTRDIRIKEAPNIKYLGVLLDAKLSFKHHVKYISSKKTPIYPLVF